MNELFEIAPTIKKQNSNGKTCRTCKHRKRFSLNEYSNKIIQCCELKKSRRSNSGYKTIKVNDTACYSYREEFT